MTTSLESKPRNPFSPDQPVPIELFCGRRDQIEHILIRGAAQVAAGKPATFFVEGEYGIGKSSIAHFCQWEAESRYGLHGIHAFLGTARELDQVAEQILAATIRSGALRASRSEKLMNFVSRFIGHQDLFGFNINLEVLRKEAPTLRSVGNLLAFLKEVIEKFRDDDQTNRGIFLILDEINGITSNPQFAHFLKEIVDSNALSSQPIPLLLLLCGTQERRRELMQRHEPVGRIFDVVTVGRLTDQETEEFFRRSFGSIGVRVEEKAMWQMVHFAAGFPKIMHLIGNSVFWQDQDEVITEEDATVGILQAADELGKKYVTPQVYEALRSTAYKSILHKIGGIGLKDSFFKADIAKELTPGEQKKFSNFLTKMKNLGVIRKGEVQGEWVFVVRMVRLYLRLQSPFGFK